MAGGCRSKWELSDSHRKYLVLFVPWCICSRDVGSAGHSEQMDTKQHVDQVGHPSSGQFSCKHISQTGSAPLLDGTYRELCGIFLGWMLVCAGLPELCFHLLISPHTGSGCWKQGTSTATKWWQSTHSSPPQLSFPVIVPSFLFTSLQLCGWGLLWPQWSIALSSSSSSLLSCLSLPLQLLGCSKQLWLLSQEQSLNTQKPGRLK